MPPYTPRYSEISESSAVDATSVGGTRTGAFAVTHIEREKRFQFFFHFALGTAGDGTGPRLFCAPDVWREMVPDSLVRT